MYPVRFCSTVANHVVAHFPAWRLNRLVDLTFRDGKAFRNNLEVIDEGFHLRLHLLAFGQDYLRSVSFDRSLWHTVDRLLHDRNGFAQLADAAHIAREHVPFLG